MLAQQQGKNVPNSANQTASATSSAGAGDSTLHDFFALTDEQILEIEPEAQDASVARDLLPVSREEKPDGQVQTGDGPAPNGPGNRVAQKPNTDSQATATSSSTGHGTQDTEHAPEPPAWLATQMKDPWTGEEARELWNGVQQAKSEAAAYRAAFANPEDARALKELYPGGVTEARSAAERARVLDDIDRAYFGVAGKSAQEVSASREQLAQRMLREDPAAFREMVFAGLRALEAPSVQANAGTGVGSRFSATSAAAGSPAAQTASNAMQAQEGLKSAPANAPAQASPETRATEREARVAAYAAFEKAANEDLERSVGATIERTLQQALPNVGRSTQDISGRAGQTPHLQARLSQAIRQNVEAALKGDRQLGEQVAQILSGRRLDEETRGQVVRLIAERAQQLVPTAAKRVLNDWTQSTLAAHRSSSARTDAASTRGELAPASVDSRRAPLSARSSGSTGRAQGHDPNRSATQSDARRVDYRKLSDEQILDL